MRRQTLSLEDLLASEKRENRFLGILLGCAIELRADSVVFDLSRGSVTITDSKRGDRYEPPLSPEHLMAAVYPILSQLFPPHSAFPRSFQLHRGGNDECQIAVSVSELSNHRFEVFLHGTDDGATAYYASLLWRPVLAKRVKDAEVDG